MESILNTISKNTSTEVFEDRYDLDLSIDFERTQEYIENEIIELNEISIDSVKLLRQKTVSNGIRGIEGELMINQNKNVLVDLDLDGTLLITDFDVEKYSINDMGELIIQL